MERAPLEWPSPITSPRAGVGGECLDLPRKVAENSLSEGYGLTLATVNLGPLAGLWGLRGGREEQPVWLFRARFDGPLPTHWCCRRD